MRPIWEVRLGMRTVGEVRLGMSTRVGQFRDEACLGQIRDEACGQGRLGMRLVVEKGSTKPIVR